MPKPASQATITVLGAANAQALRQMMDDVDRRQRKKALELRTTGARMVALADELTDLCNVHLSLSEHQQDELGRICIRAEEYDEAA